VTNYDPDLEYLGIEPEYADEVVRRNVHRAKAAARATVCGAVGDDVYSYMYGDPRLHELERIYMDDLYSNRGVSAKVSGAVRRSVLTMELQLRMDLRRLREEAAKEGGA
jgi:hypothetical protein